MKNKNILFFSFFSNLLSIQNYNNNITKFDLFVNRANSLMSVDSLELILLEIQPFIKENTALNESKKIELDSLLDKANASLARQFKETTQ